MARPRTHDHELRARLLEEGGRILAVEGPGALTTRRLAEASGTSTSAVYTLFGDKAGLVRAMFSEGFRRLAAWFAEVPRTDDPKADLLALALAYRANALANPNLYDLMFGCPFPDTRPTPEEERESIRTFLTLVEMVERAQQAGGIGGGDPYDVAVALFALVHGLASLELKGWLGAGQEAATRWDGALQATVDGLRLDPKAVRNAAPSRGRRRTAASQSRG